MKKLYYDGARTIFCIIVLMSHFTVAFLPDVKARIWNNGNLAVIYFLLLAGGVTALSVSRRNEKLTFYNTVKFASKRYLRLLPVIGISIIMAYAILLGGGTGIKKLQRCLQT